eukprot:TRINITY_DN3048_c0_g1_i11.p1 TRINITY_DN3048_c0_g1~~TRINITY_DN3048_c0_g1_i11.p1  ORF type:complete len:476 (-),score=71.12 TRINITY_DN3048_c0_g1_i11:627-2054(-)
MFVPSLLKTRRRRLQTVLLCVTLGVVSLLSVALIISTGEPEVYGGHLGSSKVKGRQDDLYSVKVENMVGYDPKEEDPELKTKRDMIKKAFIHAYGGYESKCMGEGEVRPRSGHCTNWLAEHVGLTIIDSLDTMLIMGLTEQYKRARDYLANNLDWGAIQNVEVFEFNIRCLGGLLSAYYMTNDPVLYRLSVSLGELLLPVFDSPTGYPYTWFNMKTKQKTLSSWTENALILAHLGSLQLEFAYLSHITGNVTYIEKALHIYMKLFLSKPPSRLYPLLVDINTGNWRTDTVSVGAYADSFYEYVLKYWLLTSQKNNLIGTWYFEMAEGILQYLGMWTNNETLFLGQASPSHYNPKMEHLACASGAMFALGSRHALDSFTQSKHMKAAKGIGKACHDMYNTPTGLPCEFIRLEDADVHFPPGFPGNQDSTSSFFSSENRFEYKMRPGVAPSLVSSDPLPQGENGWISTSPPFCLWSH